jgi:hypothetical protein
VTNRNQQLRRIAVGIVAQSGRCRPDDLVRRLRNAFGASHSEANRTLLELIRDGAVKRTFFGELYVSGTDDRGYPLALKAIGTVLIQLIVVFMAWVFYHLFTGA